MLQQFRNRIKPYTQLWRPYWRAVLFGILCLLVTNALAVWIPWEMKAVLDRFAAEGHLEVETQGKLLWVAGLCGLMMLIRILSRMFLLGLGRRVEHDLRDALYAKCLAVPVSFFHTYPPGEVMSRMTNDVMALRYLSGGGIMLFINTLLAYVSSLPMMWLLSPRLTVYAFLIYPVGIWLMKRLSLGVKKYYGLVQETLGELSQLAQESFSGVATIQGYGKQAEELKRFQLGCETYLGQYKGLIRQRVWLYMVVLATSGASLCLVLLEGGAETIQHHLTLPGFLAFTLYLERLSWPTMTLGWTLSLFQQGAASLQRINEILQEDILPDVLTPAVTEPKPDHQKDHQPVSHQIRLQRLTFGYTPEQPILKGVTTTLPATGLVVVVGPIGSGKSTLLRLLPKLYAVERGQLFYGTQDSADIPVAEIRHQIAYMGQQSFLFSESVANNMTYGRPQIAELLAEERERILDAYGQLVSLHEDILDMPEGYETSVGERGLLVSGGQRQRLALARALMREAPILVLDDPFSHLDAATEEMILNGLVARKVFQNRLTIVATHRFAIASQADWVLLLDHGELVAEGTHETLLKRIPLYQQLHRLSELEVACLES